MLSRSLWAVCLPPWVQDAKAQPLTQELVRISTRGQHSIELSVELQFRPCDLSFLTCKMGLDTNGSQHFLVVTF